MFEKCKSCKYYQAHYIFSGKRYFPIQGHCINEYLMRSRRKNQYQLQENCVLWEENTEVLQKRRANIKETVYKIEEQLRQLVNILENDMEQ